MADELFRRAFRVQTEIVSAHEGWYSIAGRHYGPFRSPEDAQAHLAGCIEAWQRRARALGGQVLRHGHLDLVVALPCDVRIGFGDGKPGSG